MLHRGHSRVPVFKGEKSNVVGLLLVKKLIKLDPDDCTPINTLEGAYTAPPSCLATLPLFDLLNDFQTGRSKPLLIYKSWVYGYYCSVHHLRSPLTCVPSGDRILGGQDTPLTGPLLESI